MPEKAILRARLKERLKTILPQDRRALSDRAARLLLDTDEYRHARTVMLFVSLPSEIDTSPIARDAWRTGRRVAIPRTHSENYTMEAVLIADFASGMKQTPIGVVEPLGNEAISPVQIDLILVPGLGYGPTGERIGRGAGFYDRFLANPALHAVTCGYGFETQLCDTIPMNPGDVRVQMLVTNEMIRRFRPHA